ncbi:MAG: hypothetical protein M3461_11010 [Pseudomonadota bacterium]|nr:hypothetical protein [Pseudomonadota bacterium]
MEFPLFLAIYDALVARFGGVVADEKFAVVLSGITKSRKHRYNAAYRARPQPEGTRLARAAYMRDYRARPRTEEEVTAERARNAAYMKRYRARAQ